MKNAILSGKKNKIEQIDKALVDVWDVLSPSLKRRKMLWDQFLQIQKKVQVLNMKLEKDLEK